LGCSCLGGNYSKRPLRGSQSEGRDMMKMPKDPPKWNRWLGLIFLVAVLLWLYTKTDTARTYPIVGGFMGVMFRPGAKSLI
jgi:L-asparagine transporter-like permease